MVARHTLLLTPPKVDPRLPRFAQFSCNVNPFRINTSKSVSKQTTLTPFRINTYEKHTGWGGVHFFLPRIRHARLATRLKSFPFILLRTLLHFFVPFKNSTLLFSGGFALCVKKRVAWGQGGDAYPLLPTCPERSRGIPVPSLFTQARGGSLARTRKPRSRWPRPFRRTRAPRWAHREHRFREVWGCCKSG